MRSASTTRVSRYARPSSRAAARCSASAALRESTVAAIWATLLAQRREVTDRVRLLALLGEPGVPLLGVLGGDVGMGDPLEQQVGGRVSSSSYLRPK